MIINISQVLLAAGAIFAFSNPTVAHPTVEMVKRESPKVPRPGHTDFITDMRNDSIEFPLGRAPKGQLPCRVDVRLGSSWREGPFKLFRRHRLTFRVPRTDIPPTKINEAASAAWFLNIDRSQYDLLGRCYCGAHNMQIWRGEDQVTWFMDWDDWATDEGDKTSLCGAAHFKKQWGQWTGCEWNFGWGDFKFNGTEH